MDKAALFVLAVATARGNDLRAFGSQGGLPRAFYALGERKGEEEFAHVAANSSSPLYPLHLTAMPSIGGLPTEC